MKAKAKKQQKDRIVYSICIEDVLNVAEEEFDIELTANELKAVEDKIGDYFDWRGAIMFAIQRARASVE